MVKLTTSDHQSLFVLAVYLPSSNCPTETFQETLDLLWAVHDHFCNQGIKVILGDFNGALGYLCGERISSEPNDRGRLILEFLNFFNLKAVNFDSVCTGPIDTFFSFDGQFSSAIDLTLVPRALIPYVNWAYVSEKEAENLSDHVPAAVSIKLSVLKQSID